MKNLKLMVFCLLGFMQNSCYDMDKYILSRSQAELPVFAPLNSSEVLANGVDKLPIRVLFPQRPHMDSTTVTFTTQKGVFIENDKQSYSTTTIVRNAIDDTYYIPATLKSTLDTGIYIITAEMAKFFKKSIQIKFIHAAPNEISTDKNKFYVKQGSEDEITLTAKLKAPKGLPSIGTLVDFEIDDKFSTQNPETLQYFRGFTRSDSNGLASVVFSPQGFENQTGIIKYKAITKNQDGEEIWAEGTFTIKE